MKNIEKQNKLINYTNKIFNSKPIDLINEISIYKKIKF